MTREEKMASRVLAIRNLRPPFDLTSLAEEYGDIEFLALPQGADGITIGIGGLARPKILINSEAPKTRMKFTLAHELGHVIIPWHAGTIVSHLKPGEADFDYLQMESEANRFAAELLMPTEWLVDEFKASGSIEEYFRSVLKKSGASRDAALIKIFKMVPAPIMCAHVDHGSRLLQMVRSQSAPYFSPENRSVIESDMFGDDNEFERFEIDGSVYFSWKFIGKLIDDSDERSWREILTQIQNDIGLSDKQLQSINAVLAAAFQKAKYLSESEICGSIVRRFLTRDDLIGVAKHHLFEQYVIKRVKELSLRK